MKLRNLDDLEIFIKVCDTGGFSAAARAMHLAPATVSKQIARLEQAFGASLFERNTRSLKITAEGEAVAEHARAALALLEQASDAALLGSGALAGPIRLSAPVPFGARYVAPAIAAFRRLHPQVQFELQLSDHVADLYAGNLDLAIRVGDLADSRLLARRLATSTRILVAAPQYLAERGTPRQPSDLPAHECLLFAYAGMRLDHWKLSNGQQQEAIVVQGSLSSDNGDALRAWSVAGMGIALRETWDVADDLRSGRLLRVLPQWQEDAVVISAVRARRAPVPRRISALIDFLAQTWESAPWE
ncbi:LysR substrate-binding domain-containing protein [Janthinobacterium sp. Mn2066]|uniref:LysR family transcriptional regulator n=1 Tax=Janthinobacterium sp. Mn2066 TaxID=3395264 RepID=UPI003BE98452